VERSFFAERNPLIVLEEMKAILAPLPFSKLLWDTCGYPSHMKIY
jgi:hypothetical protein